MDKLGILDVEASMQKDIASRMFIAFAKIGCPIVDRYSTFEEKLEPSLYDEIVKHVKDSYAFMKDVDITVTKEELYQVYKKYN